jgi:Tol biopolymer transport system component/DNA-binding winged helix-turn-helix (wHTH) protein
MKEAVGSSKLVPPKAGDAIIRFGNFEVDTRAGELRRGGLKVKLSGQPFDVLLALLEKPGQVVTREELHDKLWSQDTFVDFEQGLNKAINKLREALGDNADNPRFIETLPRRGYRFLVPLAQPLQTTELSASNSSTLSRVKLRHSRLGWMLTICAFLGAVGAVAALVVYRFRLPTSTRYAMLKVVPFTTYPGVEIAPGFSPDGTQIVFWWSGESDRGNSSGLYIKQLGNEKAVRLTEDSSCVVPAWSPDGRSIAFSRSNKEGSGIYLMPSLGGSIRKLTATEVGCDRFSYLSWSSDGQWLAFPDNDSKVDISTNGAHLYLLNVGTLERHMLPSPLPDCVVSWMPAFSPDGKSLAMVCMTTNDVGEIVVEPAMGGRARKIQHVQGTVHGLAWAADSQSLVYAKDGNLWRVFAGGGAVEQLPVSDAFAPAIARNGNRLAYASVRESTAIWRLDLSSRVTVKRAAFRIITSTARQTGPRISPDGRHIAFESDRSGSPEIWLCDGDGSNPVQMTSFRGPATGTVRWSPDSRWLVFDSRATGRPGIYVLSVDGGTPRQLVTGTEDATDPFWGADGRWIYFATQRNPAIWKVPAGGGNAVRLTDGGGFNPQEAADGSRIYYVRGKDRVNIWWVSPTGGPSHPLDGMPALPAGDHWTPSRSGVYFVDFDSLPGTLNLFDPATRQITRVYTLSRNPQDWGLGLNVSSDEHAVLYSEGNEPAADIMLIENFQ